MRHQRWYHDQQSAVFQKSHEIFWSRNFGNKVIQKSRRFPDSVILGSKWSGNPADFPDRGISGWSEPDMTYNVDFSDGGISGTKWSRYLENSS